MKIAIVVPGIGYHTDKPLLYYAGKLAAECGYEVVRLSFKGFIADKRKMQENYEIARTQLDAHLEAIDWNTYEDIIFITKSLGTILAVNYAYEKGISARYLLYTPLEKTFENMKENINAVVFTGTEDAWVSYALVRKLCSEKKIPLHIYKEANHSLESGQTMRNLAYLQDVMNKTAAYLCAGGVIGE